MMDAERLCYRQLVALAWWTTQLAQSRGNRSWRRPAGLYPLSHRIVAGGIDKRDGVSGSRVARPRPGLAAGCQGRSLLAPWLTKGDIRHAARQSIPCKQARFKQKAWTAHENVR